MHKVRIWFNDWFTDMYNGIELLKDSIEADRFEIYATSKDENHPMLYMADHAEIEPKLENNELYIDYCKKYIQDNKIDVFIPYFRMKAIIEHLNEFEEIGVKVMVPCDTQVISLINDKAKFNTFYKETCKGEVPEYYVATNLNEFKAAYNDITSKGKQVCFKPVEGVGGIGFYKIRQNDNISTDERINKFDRSLIMYEDAERWFGLSETFKPMLIMEFIEGTEYSLDCVANKGKMIACVCRLKGSKQRVLESVPMLEKMGAKIVESLGLSNIFNIQFIVKDGTPYIIEVNPRISAGIAQSSMCGVNLMYYAVKNILGEKMDVPKVRKTLVNVLFKNQVIPDDLKREIKSK